MVSENNGYTRLDVHELLAVVGVEHWLSGAIADPLGEVSETNHHSLNTNFEVSGRYFSSQAGILQFGGLL